jgi:ribonuclease VapC
MNWSETAVRRRPLKKDAKAVMDASAVLALIQDERGAETLRPLLPRAVVCSVNIAEVLAKLVRDGMPRAEASVALDALHLEEVAFDAADAERSAGYVTKGVSLGDRCFLAAAARYGEGFTSDRELSERVHGAPPLHGFR